MAPGEPRPIAGGGPILTRPALVAVLALLASATIATAAAPQSFTLPAGDVQGSAPYTRLLGVYGDSTTAYTTVHIDANVTDAPAYNTTGINGEWTHTFPVGAYTLIMSACNAAHECDRTELVVRAVNSGASYDPTVNPDPDPGTYHEGKGWRITPRGLWNVAVALVATALSFVAAYWWLLGRK